MDNPARVSDDREATYTSWVSASSFTVARPIPLDPPINKIFFFHVLFIFSKDAFELLLAIIKN